jgi:hypothetical protein
VIRRPYHGGWILISQRDHAALSGALMARWGNEAFTGPTPPAEVLLGISVHDDGWDAWDRSPGIHGETGYPLQFTELTSEAYIPIWRRGVEHHREASPYAALLIALHTEHLARRRVEKVLGHAADEEAARLTAFIAEMERLRQELADAVMAQSETASERLEAEIKTNFRLLQIGDLISLELCGGPSGPFSVERAPARVKGRFASVTFEPASEDVLVAHPYPFSEPDVEVSVSGWILHKKVFTSSAELRDSLREADPINLMFRLTPAAHVRL